MEVNVRILKAFSITTLWLAPVLSAAQTPRTAQWPLDSGSRVKVLSPLFGQRSGIVVSTVADTLTFRPRRDAASIAVAAPSIAKLEVSSGTYRYGAIKGLAFGFVAGAVVGAVLGAATYSPSSCQEFCLLDRGGSAGLAAGLLGITGGLVGLLIGAAPHDKWVPVALPSR